MPPHQPAVRGATTPRRAHVPRGPLAALATLVAGLAVLSSCTSAKLDESLGDDATTTTSATFTGDPGTDATVDPVDSGPGPVLSGNSPLKGLRGATPGVRITEDFRRRILEIDPEVTDLTGAAEGYDIVTILAVSTEGARSDAPGRIADEVVLATAGGRTCTTFTRCRALALKNEDYDYDGVSGGIDLLGNGDPGEAGFGVVEYDGTGAPRAIDQMTVQAKPLTGQSTPPDPTYGPPGDGKLQIGTLLPVSGPDGAAARAALAGVRLAVDEINDLGGVLGEPIELVADESGDGSSTATATAVRKLIDAEVDAIVGGTTYAITSVAVPYVTEAGIVLFSPTDTARALSITPDRSLFFRLAPPTDLEGQVLGTLIANDGYTRVAIAAGTDAEDLELAADVAAAVNAASGTVTATIDVGPDADAADVTQQLIDSDPQAIVIVTPVDSAAAVVKAMVVKGKSPSTIGTYGTAANMVPRLVELVGAG